MPNVEIYTSPLCGFCHAAKRLLTSRDPAKKQEMMQRANGRHTVPQIFIDATHVGGCDDLFDLERANKLDPLLAA